MSCEHVEKSFIVQEGLRTVFQPKYVAALANQKSSMSLPLGFLGGCRLKHAIGLGNLVVTI